MKTDNNTHSDTQNATQGKESLPRKISSKQVVAMAGVILLVLLYVIALIASIVDSSASGSLMWMCLFATIAVPILIWIYIWMYGKLTGKKTMNNPGFDAEKEDETPDIPQ